MKTLMCLRRSQESKANGRVLLLNVDFEFVFFELDFGLVNSSFTQFSLIELDFYVRTEELCECCLLFLPVPARGYL